jgi:hypothetical protein
LALHKIFPQKAPRDKPQGETSPPNKHMATKSKKTAAKKAVKKPAAKKAVKKAAKKK